MRRAFRAADGSGGVVAQERAEARAGDIERVHIGAGDARKALAVYKDVAANSKDETALANAKTRIEEIEKVLEN